uniref:Meckelin n=1 Tax=Globodera pallida TaxID=36090 RepID=A0A183BTN8_GLOPA
MNDCHVNYTEIHPSDDSIQLLIDCLPFVASLGLSVSLLILSTFVALHITAQQPSLPVSFKWQNVAQCYGGENGTFFNVILMSCDKCPEGMEPTSERLNECQCAPGRILSSSGIPQGRNDCAACEKDHAVSSDLAFCVKCLTSDGSLLSPDINTGKCPPCAGGQEIAQFNWHKMNGNGLIFEQCTRCPDGTTPNGAGDKCVPCQSATCMCEKNSSLPFCIDLATDSYQIPLLLVDGANVAAGFASDYIKLNLRDAELACKRADRRQCAHLANLCTLQDYARTSGGACNALENARVSLQQTTSQQSIVPQLFYANIDASMEIFRGTAIDAIYELVDQRRNSRLDIVAMAFSINGTFLSQMPFDNVFMQKCPSTSWRDLAKTALRFGTFFRQKCAWILENAGTENIFFELYIRFEDTNGETKLYPMPILNENIRGDQYTGLYPNRLDRLRRDSRVLITKRFYVVDRQSAADQSLKNQTNQLVRSPDRITLHIHLQPNQEGRIFVPYLQISHVQIQQHQRQNNSSSSSTFSSTDTFLVEFEFRISYHADSYPYDKTVEVVMATTCSIAAVWAAMRAYSWGRRSGKLIIDASTILKMVLYAADGIGNIFLLVMSIIAVWLTFAYKLQSHLFYVPLADVQEGSFVAYLVSATALKALSLAHTLISLTLIQTFFIDWERPRTLSTQKQPIDNSKVEDKTAQNSVVIWRTYLIANEWNELQLYRKTRLSVQLLTALFLLDGMEFGNFAKLQPGSPKVGQPSEIVETRMSRFAVDIFFYFGIEMAQWLVQVVVVERLVDPFRNFMDLCSVANISVLAMTNPLRGFYIHGRSVHGFADTDMLQMNVFLQRERDNLCAMRGLEMGSDLQTFVVNVPRAFREKIDQIMTTASTNGAAIARQSTNTLDKTTLHMHQIAMAYNELNEYFKDFVNRVDPQCDYVLTSPRLVEVLLGLELTDTSGVGTFRRDPSECEYSSAFLYGNEWALMSFEMLLFCLVDLWWRSRLLAAFVTYLLSTGIGHMVKLYFTHQLAKSSMVDSRFLI